MIPLGQSQPTPEWGIEFDRGGKACGADYCYCRRRRVDGRSIERRKERKS